MKRFIPTTLLIIYTVVLIKVMVFKSVPTINVGGIMLNFGGTNGSNPPNLIPFKTILPYLHGEKGLIIAGINLVGNIVLLIPIGFLIPFVFRKMTWKTSFVFAALSGLIIEILQVILKVGIFDIDDVILNAFGFLIGYWIYLIFTKYLTSTKAKVTFVLMLILLALASLCCVTSYLKSQAKPRDQIMMQKGSDLCGGTGGTGEIIEIRNNTISIKRNDGLVEPMNITDKTEIKTSAGPAQITDLKVGDRATIVIFDGKNAAAVLVCN